MNISEAVQEYKNFEDFLDEMSDEEIAYFYETGEVKENPRVMKVKRSEKRSRSRDYKKKRAAIKRAGAKYRKTAAFKRYDKKRKLMKKRGLTSTGKKIKKKRII